MTLQKLIALWESGDVPIDDEEHIEAPWAGFPVGTPREKVWHWFDEQFAEYDTCLGEYLEMRPFYRKG